MAGIARNSAGFMSATASTWQSTNPIVPKRTFAVSSDTQEIRLGDGATHWANLPVFANASGQPLDGSLYAALAGATFTGAVAVPDAAYDATTWNGSANVPTKNAVRDEIEGHKVDAATHANLPYGQKTEGSLDITKFWSGDGSWRTPSGGGIL